MSFVRDTALASLKRRQGRERMSKCTNEEMGKMGKLDDNKEEEREKELGESIKV